MCHGSRGILLCAWICSSLLWVTLSAGQAEAQVSKEAQACISALNKSFDRVSRTWIHEIRSCLKDAARGRLPGLTIEKCLSADRRGKVGRVEARTRQLETRKCSADPPAFGSSSAPVVNQTAFTKEINLVHDIFGSDLDVAILAHEGATQSAADCQQAVAQSVFKCQERKVHEFNRCKRLGLKAGSLQSAVELAGCLGQDDRGKIAQACNPLAGKIARTVAHRCIGTGVALAAVFPGCESDDTGILAACLDRIVECRTCLALSEADAFALDCDLFDDGIANASCAPCSHCAFCGNGEVEEGEQCDGQSYCSGDCQFIIDTSACCQAGSFCVPDEIMGSGCVTVLGGIKYPGRSCERTPGGVCDPSGVLCEGTCPAGVPIPPTRLCCQGTGQCTETLVEGSADFLVWPLVDCWMSGGEPLLGTCNGATCLPGAN